MRYFLLRFYPVVISLLIFNFCKKDTGFQEDINPIIKEQNDRLSIVVPSAKITSFIHGVVKDESGFPLSGVLLKIGELEVLSNSEGEFLFGEINTHSSFTKLQAEKSGYFTGFKTFSPTENSVNEVTLVLMSKGTAKSFNSTGSAVLEFEGSKINLSFPAKSISRENGDLYEGNVRVYARYIDPESDNFLESMPGALVGLNNSNQLDALVSFGMVHVELEDGSGNSLQIKNGEKVQVTLPAKVSDPDELPTWHFNETYGLWVEAGIGTKTGDKYTFEANHFSTWNLDAKVGAVDVKIIIENEMGERIGNQLIDISYTAFLTIKRIKRVKTDENGELKLLRAPDNMTFRFISECSFFDKEVSVTASTMTIIVNSADLNSNIRNVNLSGEVLGCTNDKYPNSYFILRGINGNKLSFSGKSTSSGDYSLGGLFCNVETTGSYLFESRLYLPGGTTLIDTFGIEFSTDNVNYNLEFCNSSEDTSDFIILFEDINFENAVRFEINKPTGPVLKSDVIKITNLNAFSDNIISINGIQHFDSLKFLNLDFNQLMDLSYLQGLTKLKSLSFSNNNVSNLSPLQNSIKLEWLTLTDNVVSDISYISNLTSLIGIGFDKNNIEDITPLGFLINAEKIYISENKITNLSPLCNLGSSFTGLIEIKNNNPPFTTQQKEDLMNCLPNATVIF